MSGEKPKSFREVLNEHMQSMDTGTLLKEVIRAEEDLPVRPCLPHLHSERARHVRRPIGEPVDTPIFKITNHNWNFSKK